MMLSFACNTVRPLKNAQRWCWMRFINRYRIFAHESMRFCVIFTFWRTTHGQTFRSLVYILHTPAKGGHSQVGFIYQIEGVRCPIYLSLCLILNLNVSSDIYCLSVSARQKIYYFTNARPSSVNIALGARILTVLSCYLLQIGVLASVKQPDPMWPRLSVCTDKFGLVLPQ